MRASCLDPIDGVHCHMDWKKASDGTESGVYKVHVILVTQDPRVSRGELEEACEVGTMGFFLAFFMFMLVVGYVVVR